MKIFFVKFIAFSDIEDTKGVMGNELELIALVRNCQFLYDKHHPDFKDIQKKTATWNAIASVMQASGTYLLLCKSFSNVLRLFYSDRGTAEMEKFAGSVQQTQQGRDVGGSRFVESVGILRRYEVHRTAHNS